MKWHDLKRVEIRYTATIIEPDGSDTNGYGEPCEPGYGYVIHDGWWNPDWSRFSVFETPEESRVDTFDLDEIRDAKDRFATADEFLADHIGDVIGGIDHHDGLSFYGLGEETNYQTGENVIAAAHVTIRETIAETFVRGLKRK